MGMTSLEHHNCFFFPIKLGLKATIKLNQVHLKQKEEKVFPPCHDVPGWRCSPAAPLPPQCGPPWLLRSAPSSSPARTSKPSLQEVS